MATDPNMTDEQKRRERERERNRLTRPLPPWAQPQRPAAPQQAYTPGQSFGVDLASDAQPTRANTQTPTQRPQVQLLDPTERSSNVAADRRAAGLTRIYKTKDAKGNSVYTDQGYLDATGSPAPVGAEERYYGALGQRIEAGDDRARFAAADQQRRGLGRMLADGAAIRAGNDPSNPNDYQWVQDPNNPGSNTVMSRAQREANNPELATARARAQAAGAPSMGDLIQLLRLQTDQANRAEDRNLRERGLQRMEQNQLYNLAYDDEGNIRPEFLRGELAQLRGRSPQELDEYFGTNQGRFVQSVLNDQLRRTYENRAPTFLGGVFLDNPQNFGDLRPAGALSGTIPDLFRGQRYNTEGDTWQRGVSAEDLGLAQPDLDMLMQYYLRQNALQ